MLLLSRLPSVLSEFVRLYSINSLINAALVKVKSVAHVDPGLVRFRDYTSADCLVQGLQLKTKE